MKHMLATAALSSCLLLPAADATAQQVSDRGPVITVRGDGRTHVPPDMARLSVDVVTKGKTLEAATSAHRDRASKAAVALHAMEKDGIAIEQSTFRLDQVYLPTPPQSMQRPDTEYQAVTSFQLKSKKLDTVDATITAIAATGLFEIRNLRFMLDEKNKAIDEARKNAVADARERAKIYAEAAGVQLGDIVEINDVEPHVMREYAAPMAAARNVQVNPPESIALNAGVTITWRIKQP